MNSITMWRLPMPRTIEIGFATRPMRRDHIRVGDGFAASSCFHATGAERRETAQIGPAAAGFL
jgi:hypothetical protein